MKRNNRHKLFRLLALIAALSVATFFISNRTVPSWQLVLVVLFVLALSVRTTRQTAIDWIPIFVYFLAYSFTRGLVFKFIKYNAIPVHRSTLLNWEKALFGENIPTLFFQQFVGDEPGILDSISLFLYSSFFWGTFLVAFIIWMKSRIQYHKFISAFIMICTLGLLTYLLFPAYPPWKAAEVGLLPPIQRHMWSKEVGVWMSSIFGHFNYNPFAPMPSLHVAWAVLTSFALDRFFAVKWHYLSKISYFYALSVSLTVIYSGDHYVVDIIAGVIYSTFAILITYSNWLEKLKNGKTAANI